MEQLLATKLYIPSIRTDLVPRSRLIEKLNGGLNRKLTLICAPAGYGKSTLVADWVPTLSPTSTIKYRISWLSLDKNDNAPTRFLTYLIFALNQSEEGETALGKNALTMLQAPQPSIEAVCTSLINDVSAIPDRIVLVLDDYHVIESPQVDDALTFLIEHLPPQLHLVIVTRVDPQISLARLRARNQLIELRASDLRFTSSEAADFLNRVMGFDLSDENIAALETRTEGWITGLQMASISLQGRKDVDGFIKSFTGSHRYVLDYLIEEVLEQQPKSVQTFMFQTAILDRLTGSLCNAVTGQENGQETLEMLESANLFIIPLDDERRWYRYHHLFANLLQQRLKSSPKINIQDLHIRIRNWFSKQGMEREALQHSLLAEDFQKAAELINRLSMEVLHKGEYRTVSDWINSLPYDIQQEHPFLWALDGWALRMEGQFEAAETRISEVEEALKNPAHRASADLETIKGLINSHKAYIAFIRGNFNQTISISRESLTQLPQDMVEIRTLTALYLGVALRYQGNLQEALEIYLNTLPYGKQLVGSSIAVFCFIHLSDLYYDLGELQKSREIAEQAIQFTNQHTGRPDWPFMGHLYVCIGRVLRQWGRLTEALEVILKGVGLCRQWNVADFQALACIELADVYFSLGEKELAQDALKESFLIYQEFSPWASGLVAAHQAKHSLGFGEIELAIEWLGGTDLKANSPIDLSRDIEFLTMARVFIAQNKLDEGLVLLNRISEVSDEIGKNHTALEAIILQAKALFIHDDTEKAMEKLEQALSLGEAEEYVQIFVDEGSPMARLLYDALSKGIMPEYVQRLLAAFPVEKPEPAEKQPSQESEWVEPLTDREVEILQLLADGFTNPVIGSKLYLATNTVKAHLRNIYGKLGVNNRTQAVARARGLGIISDR